ncbi:MAG: hypothetical protein R2864_00095 [Syntrophotaleaceae bacterium]
MLVAKGFDNVYNLSGGYETYLVATTKHKATKTAPAAQTEHKVIPMVKSPSATPRKLSKSTPAACNAPDR